MGVPYEIGASTSQLDENLVFVIIEKPEDVVVEFEDVRTLFGYEFDVTQYGEDYYYEKDLTPDEIEYFRELRREYVTVFSGEFGIVYKKKGKESLKEMQEKRKSNKPIKRKLYLCNIKGCNWRGAILSKGMCPYHYAQMYNKDKADKHTVPTKKINDKLQKTLSMNEFFRRHIKILKGRPYSDFKDTPIRNPSRTNVCHILPKREQGGFPSVAEDDDNIFYLTWQQHHNMDKWIDERDFEKFKAEMPELYEMFINRIKVLLAKVDERPKLYFDLKRLIENEQDI